MLFCLGTYLPFPVFWAEMEGSLYIQGHLLPYNLCNFIVKLLLSIGLYQLDSLSSLQQTQPDHCRDWYRFCHWQRWITCLISERAIRQKRRSLETGQSPNSKLHLKALTSLYQSWLVKNQLHYFFHINFYYIVTYYLLTFGANICTTLSPFWYRELGVMLVHCHDMLLSWFLGLPFHQGQ